MFLKFSFPGRGTCGVRVKASVEYSSTEEISSIDTFFPAREGYMGFCQSLKIVDVVGVGSTSVKNYKAEKKIIGQDEVVGYNLNIGFENSFKPHFNISYDCVGLQHFNLFKAKHVISHVYTVNLVLLSHQRVPSQVVQANVVFPFNVTKPDIVSVSIPEILSSTNGSAVRFRGINVNTFTLAFAFDYSVYDATCGVGSGSISQYIADTAWVRYSLIGGAVVGGLALLAAIVWFIVKKAIKRKVNTTGFKLLGSDVDIITDDETNPDSIQL